MSRFYEVTAVSAERNRLEQYGKDNGVQIFPVEMTRAITPIQDLKSLFQLYRFLKKEKPLIVHTHTPKAGIIGMLAAKMAGVPIRLHTVAGLPLLETTGNKRKVLDTVEKLTYHLATKVYPNSFKLKEIILDLRYAKESKLKVLGQGSSNGIDTSYFDPSRYNSILNQELKNNLGISENDFIYIFVGRLVKEKGINELVRSFVNLHKKVKNISLLLVGPFEQDLDPLDHDVFDLIHSHPKIFTTGYQVDVRPYFAISDALAFPSYREGFPNVVMQANAMELPVIVSDINGCNEIVTNEENGLIVEVKNQEKLEAAMERLLKDTTLMKNLSEKARGTIQTKYEREKFWQILLKEYKELEVLYKHD
ncbi:glycosyltransferase family 4 protein [Gramella sp. MT6]|nr:glycosyltransferase family 4 protein [Gramella sp. MT6]